MTRISLKPRPNHGRPTCDHTCVPIDLAHASGANSKSWFRTAIPWLQQSWLVPKSSCGRSLSGCEEPQAREHPCHMQWPTIPDIAQPSHHAASTRPTLVEHSRFLGVSIRSGIDLPIFFHLQWFISRSWNHGAAWTIDISTHHRRGILVFYIFIITCIIIEGIGRCCCIGLFSITRLFFDLYSCVCWRTRLCWACWIRLRFSRVLFAIVT